MINSKNEKVIIKSPVWILDLDISRPMVHDDRTGTYSFCLLSMNLILLPAAECSLTPFPAIIYRHILHM